MDDQDARILEQRRLLLQLAQVLVLGPTNQTGPVILGPQLEAQPAALEAPVPGGLVQLARQFCLKQVAVFEPAQLGCRPGAARAAQELGREARREGALQGGDLDIRWEH